MFRRKTQTTAHINEAAWQATRFLAIEASYGDSARYYDSKDVVAEQDLPPRTVTVYTWYLVRLEIVGFLGHIPASDADLDLIEQTVGAYVRSLVGLDPKYVRLAVQMMFDIPREAADMDAPAFTSLLGVMLGGLIRGKAAEVLDEDKKDLEAYLVQFGGELRHGLE